MSFQTVRTLLEGRLASMPGALPTAWEDTPFTPPAATALWKKVYLLRGRTQNPTMGDGHERQVGLLQVTVLGPLGVGNADVTEAAELIAAHFARGLTLESSAPKVRVLIDESPWLASGPKDPSYACVILSIPYVADVYP